MTHSTTMAIRAYSRDEAQTDAYDALLDYYGKTNLLNISEEMGLAFLQKLRDGEIRLYENTESQIRQYIQNQKER